MVGRAAGKISVSTVVESLLLVVCRAESRRIRKRSGGSTSWSVRVRECLTGLSTIAGLSVIAERILSHVIVCLGATIDRSWLAFSHAWGGTSARWKRSIVIGESS